MEEKEKKKFLMYGGVYLGVGYFVLNSKYQQNWGFSNLLLWPTHLNESTWTPGPYQASQHT